MTRSAVFSPCRQYRYKLERVWNPRRPTVAFIALNPSTADESIDDPTIRRCMSFAGVWGFGGLVMLNLFAFRATDPTELCRRSEIIGDENDFHIKQAAGAVVKVIAAWGNQGSLMRRDQDVRAMVRPLYHLGLTKQGQPKHPLYLRRATQPEEWR